MTRFPPLSTMLTDGCRPMLWVMTQVVAGTCWSWTKVVGSLNMKLMLVGHQPVAGAGPLEPDAGLPAVVHGQLLVLTQLSVLGRPVERELDDRRAGAEQRDVQAVEAERHVLVGPGQRGDRGLPEHGVRLRTCSC